MANSLLISDLYIVRVLPPNMSLWECGISEIFIENISNDDL